MASKQMIAQCLTAIRQIYPNFAKDDEEIEIKAKLWEKLLHDYTDEQVSKALYICLQEMTYPPVPANLIEKLKPNKAELWDELNSALNRTFNLMENFNYTAKDENGISQGTKAKMQVQEIWDNLSPELKGYIGSKGQMMILARYDDKQMQFERGIFMKSELRKHTVQQLIELKSDNLKKIEKN